MWAVITGASSGIGKDMARELANKGYKLILVARRENLLKELAQDLEVETKILSYDLTNLENCHKVFEECKNLEISVVINNAGFGGHGKFDTRNWATDKDMIDLNIQALTLICHLFIPLLKKQENSYLLNVASSAGFLPGPGMAVYYATKAYVLSLSEALYQEYKDDKIWVSALCPGPVDTEFSRVANTENVKAFKGNIHTSNFVAKQAIEGLFAKKAIIIPGLSLNILLRFGIRFLPRSVVRKISQKAMTTI